MLTYLLSQSWSIALMCALLVGMVLMAVHHAEIIAHKVGEPFGTIILALSVTVIEVSLIISMMISHAPGSELIARDTVFAAIMLVANGVIGLCIFFGALKHKDLNFRVEGNNSALAVLIALATFSLVLPIFTTSTPGPDFTQSQLAFAGIASFTLYVTFIFFQVVSHRVYFLPLDAKDQEEVQGHSPVPSNLKTIVSGFLLLLSLVCVVVLAEGLSPVVESFVHEIGAPKSVVGIFIAALVLLPEGTAAIRAARSNHLQGSLNLALGSALASIGLTIPAVAAISIIFGLPLSLGVNDTGIVFLCLTFVVSTLTFSVGRVTILQGMVHLIIFFGYLFLSLVP